MPKASNIIPVSDFRQDAASILDRVQRDKTPVVITRRGRAAAVLIGIEEYEKLEHERQLLYILAKGEAQIKAGQGFDLDDVMREADQLLSGD